MGAMQRRKGATFERWVANVLRTVYPGAKRGLAQPRDARECADVEGTPWWPEAKHGKAVSIVAAYEQAVAATDGRAPLVISRIDGKTPLATMSLDAFVALVRELEQLRTWEVQRGNERGEEHHQ